MIKCQANHDSASENETDLIFLLCVIRSKSLLLNLNADRTITSYSPTGTS